MLPIKTADVAMDMLDTLMIECPTSSMPKVQDKLWMRPGDGRYYYLEGTIGVAIREYSEKDLFLILAHEFRHHYQHEQDAAWLKAKSVEANGFLIKYQPQYYVWPHELDANLFAIELTTKYFGEIVVDEEIIHETRMILQRDNFGTPKHKVGAAIGCSALLWLGINDPVFGFPELRGVNLPFTVTKGDNQ